MVRPPLHLDFPLIDPDHRFHKTDSRFRILQYRSLLNVQLKKRLKLIGRSNRRRDIRRLESKTPHRFGDADPVLIPQILKFSGKNLARHRPAAE